MILNYSWITVILLIAQSNWSFTAAASNQPNNLCSHTNVQALSWYAIEPKEDKKMWLIVYDSEMKKKKNQIRLEAIQNHEYRLFFKKDYVVVVVRCKEDDEGIISCGYKEFNLKALTAEERKNSARKLREYNDIGWSFEAFTTQNELDDGIDMSRIYLVDENLYLNYNYYYDLKAKKLINIHINADNHAALVAGCFVS
uniref:Uncharacterized protein n=1 Tax=Panagrolaimus sp. ES5 TaxID=591445 RepID=A0AC34GED9_9BILA